ncbi:MAG: PstS family phosphate ABC transporter substrate-binding protein [Cyanobacteria bacterium P01_D01_bin.1]
MTTSAKKFFTSFKVLGATAAVATIGLASVAANAQSRLIAIDGSSTVFPITEAMAEDFTTTVDSDVNVTVGVSGTGGGFKKFCAGETVISNASRPIKDSEIELCESNGISYEVIPVAFDAITVVVNPNNTWAEDLTIEELQTIWDSSSEGTITTWNQIDASFPDAPLNLYGPGSDSGTFDYFNEEILGDEGASRADYTASEDDNVLVTGVSRDQNALGYFGMSYYLENRDILKAVGVSSEATGGEAVVPSPETINDYKPLAREIFIYVNTDAMASRPEVRSFVEYYLTRAAETEDNIISEVGYVPLDAADYAESIGML